MAIPIDPSIHRSLIDTVREEMVGIRRKKNEDNRNDFPGAGTVSGSLVITIETATAFPVATV